MGPADPLGPVKKIKKMKKSPSAQWKVEDVGPCEQSDSGDGRDGCVRALTVRQPRSNVTEWRNESMEKTHNPYYKGFWLVFL